MSTRHVSLLMSLGVLAGCAPANDTDPAADEAAIRRVLAEEVTAGDTGDLDRFLEAFSPDAVLMPPGSPAVTGEPIQAFARGMFEQVEIDFPGYEEDTIIILGDWAIHQHSFTWTVTPKAGGEPVTEHGKGLHVLHRQANGAWKITHDVWNTDSVPDDM